MNRPRQTIAHLPVEQLTANPANVRENLGGLGDLARSIHELGVLEPLLVTEHTAGGYLLLDGHRRLGAGVKAGLASFPAIIRHDVTDMVEQTITMLATDVHKKMFTPMERARAYGYLRDVEGLIGREIAQRLGVSTATVAAYLNLLHLDDETAEKVDAGDLAVGQAVAAVVETRQADRVAAGTPVRGRPKAGSGVPWFGAQHRLSAHVKATCRHRERSQLGGSYGCGPCWEQAIFDAYSEDAAAAAAAAADVDPVLVQRIVGGEWHLAASTTNAEKHAIADAWRARGGSGRQLAEHTGWNEDRYGHMPGVEDQVAS